MKPQAFIVKGALLHWCNGSSQSPGSLLALVANEGVAAHAINRCSLDRIHSRADVRHIRVRSRNNRKPACWSLRRRCRAQPARRWRTATSRWTSHLPLRHVRRRTVVDQRAAHARRHCDGPSRDRAGGGPQGRCRGVAARSHRRAAGRASRSDQPRRHHRIVTAECRRRRPGQGQRRGPADQRRHHVRALPLLGRQLLYDGHRQAAGRMGEHRSERGGDRGPLAGAGCSHQGRVQRLGPRQI